MNPPKAPDPFATAAAQTQSNLATTKAQQETGMVNQNNPYGSLNYNQTGTNPDGTAQYTADTTLNGTGQQLLDASNQNKLQTGALASNLLSSKTGALSGTPLDLSWGATQANLDKLNQNTLDPQWQHNQTQLDQTLMDKGVTPGSEAYDTAMRNFGQQKSDAYNNMYLQGHNTAVNDITQQYNSPLQTYSTLMTGSQPQNPSFQPQQQTPVAGTNISGLINSNYQNQVSQNNAMMGGLFGLGGAAITGGASLMKPGAVTNNNYGF